MLVFSYHIALKTLNPEKPQTDACNHVVMQFHAGYAD